MIVFSVSTPDEKRSISVSRDNAYNSICLLCKLPVEDVVRFLTCLEQRGYTVKMFELHEPESQVYIARPQCRFTEFLEALDEMFTEFMEL